MTINYASSTSTNYKLVLPMPNEKIKGYNKKIFRQMLHYKIVENNSKRR